MTIFYAAVEDDPLTSGKYSRVHASGKTSTIKGEDGVIRRMAFIGDSAWCVACQSMGIIIGGAPVPENRRMLDLVNGGRRQAVGGDEVACKCAIRPRIIAIYGRKFTITAVSASHRFVIARDAVTAGASPSSSVVTAAFDEQVRAAAPGVVLDGYPYFIETTDGHTFYGAVDATGRLPRIKTGVADTYTIYWGDDALAQDVAS